MASRTRGFVSRIALSFSSLVLVLVAAEAVTRCVTNVVPPLDVIDRVVGKTYVPGFADPVYVDECDCDVFLRFNREGFRGPDRPYEKAAGMRRIAVIGDSMIAAIATAEEDTLVAKLEGTLNTAAVANEGGPEGPGSKQPVRWQAMNFGVSGASTAQEWVLYRARVRRYHPDVVLLGFFLRNDLTDNSPTLGNSPYVYFDLDEQGRLIRVRTDAIRPARDAWLDHVSRFYVWQKLMFGRIHGRWGRLDRSRLAYLHAPEGDAKHAWEITRALLRAFRDDVEADGATFVVAALPGAESVYDDVWRELLARSGESVTLYDRDAPERALAEICRTEHIPLVTMTEAFRSAATHASSQRGDERLFWQGIGHFNARGNAIAAATIARALTTPGLRTRP